MSSSSSTSLTSRAAKSDRRYPATDVCFLAIQAFHFVSDGGYNRNASGEVFEAKALVRHPWFRESALNAAVQWKFKPMLVNERLLPLITTVSVFFDTHR
jgi:hypothetical protein